MPPYVKIVLGKPVSAKSHFHAPDEIGRSVFRTVPLARLSRTLRRAVPGSFPDAALSGRPGAGAGTSRLHLRRDGDVPASVPAGCGGEEYGHEVARVVEFLQTDGRSLLEAIGHSRDRLSEEMKFEEAARQHKRFEKVQDVLKLQDDLARDVDRLNGVAITRSLAADAVELWFVREGHWQEPRRFQFGVMEGVTISLDRKLRESFAEVEARRLPVRERREYLALLARWYYSSWRDGEWLGFESFEDIPYRKLVNAVSRVGGAGRQLV